jgi:hypothetical protein
MKYNLKDKVWIHLGEAKLTEGRVVEIIDLEHLNEGYKKENELYVIEVKTGIDDVYEVRQVGQISPDASGPITMWRNAKEAVAANRMFKKIGTPLPESAVTYFAQNQNGESAPAAEKPKRPKRRYYKSKKA